MPFETEVKTYSPGELAALYEIHTRTLNRWLKPFSEKIGKRNGRFYTPKQVQAIFDVLGDPEPKKANSN